MSGDDDAALDETPVAGPAPEASAAAVATGAEPAPAPSEEPKGLEAVPEPPPTREAFDELKRERNDLRDQLLRKRADFENFRKRVERDRVLMRDEATTALLKSLLPTLDNLERALAAAAAEDPLRAGVELIHRDLRALIESSGVVVEDPTGRRFDPEIHQALSHELAPGFEDGTVVEVLQKGYFLNDRLLRPALVKVAKGDAADDGEPEAVH